MKGFAEVVEIPETKKDEKYIFGTIKNNGDSSYVTFDGSDFLTPITSAMGYEDGDRVMVMVKSHRAIVVNNMTSPAVTGKYVKENYASFENLSATNAQIGYLRANMITADALEAKIGEFGYLKADQADLKFATIENLNASNAEIGTLKATTIKTDNLAAEVAKLGYAEITDLNAATGRIDTLESTMITADNLRTEIAKIGYLTADEADIRYLTVSTADTKFLHADMSDMDIAKIQTLFATAGIVSDMTIKDGHITGELSGIKVSANDISAGRLDAATIEVVNLNAANITVGTINGTQIATGAIDLTKLGSDVTDKLADTEDDVAKAVADAKKAIADSLTAQNTANSATSTANSAKNTANSATSTANSALSTANSATSTANAANSLASTAKSTADSANATASNAVNIANGISVGGRNLIRNTANGFVLAASSDNWSAYKFDVTTSPLEVGVPYAVGFNVSFVTGSDSKITVALYNNDLSSCKAIVDCPVGSGRIECILTPDSTGANKLLIYAGVTGTTANKGIRITNLKLEKGNKATDWTPAPEDVDSSINTASIKNWCYNGDLAWMNGAKIYANTIVSDAIATDAITAVKIKAGAITADKLAANSVTAGTIVAGSITTDKISANAVSADKIASNAVTADKILGKSITAAKIASGTITSDEIASGTIKAANINVTDLVGNSAFINSLKSNTVIVGLQNDINGISVGGRNLVIGSSPNVTNSYYPVVDFNLSMPLVPGEEYTIQFWGALGREWIGVWLNGGWDPLGDFVCNDSKTYGCLRFRAPTGGSAGGGAIDYSRIFIFPGPNGTGSATTITKVKLEKGNKPTDWTPAPEDVDSSISAAQSTANSANTLAGTANSAAGAAQTTANTALNNTNRGLGKWLCTQYGNCGKTIEGIVGKKATPVSTFELADGSNGLSLNIADYYTGYAKTYCYFTADTSISTDFYSDDAGTVYLNAVQIGQNAQYGQTAVTLPFKKGWNVIEVVWNDGEVTEGFKFGTTISNHANCQRMDCYAAPPILDYYTICNGAGRWCYNNDITYINGGKIYTGTVTADKINVSSLSAISANIGTVTAGTIQSNNYVKDVSGMKLSLADGSWDSKYTKIDSDGKITCSNIGITGGSIDLTGDTGDTVLVNIKKGNTTLKLSPNGIDQRKYNGNASASGLKNETQTMSLKNRRIEIDDTQAYSTYDIFSSVVIDIMAHADGGKTSLELHDNNGSTRVLTSSMLTSKELSFSNNKKTWTVGISGTIPELLVSCDSTKVIEINPSWSLSGSGVGVGLNADLYMTGTAAYTTDGSRNVTTQTWCGKTVQLFPYVYGNGVYRLAYCGSYMEVASDAGAYGVTWWESDVRLKENFTPVNFDVLDCIRDLKFKAFDWKDKSKENIHQRLGLVADEVQCIIPEAVFEVGENKIKNINTGIMSTYALKGVQDLYARIRLLEQEVINLQNQLLQKGNQNG